jgi:sarcosine oxidase, subunit delta
MLLIPCPWCGPRAETEFTCGGEADIARPSDPEALTDEAWGDYLFMRRNTLGVQREQWHHSFGCRRWFVIERDTVTYAVESIETPNGGPS